MLVARKWSLQLVLLSGKSRKIDLGVAEPLFLVQAIPNLAHMVIKTLAELGVCLHALTVFLVRLEDRNAERHIRPEGGHDRNLYLDVLLEVLARVHIKLLHRRVWLL